MGRAPSFVPNRPPDIAAGTRDYRLIPATRLPRGTGVDGYVDASTRPWTLREPTIAAPFAPGTPDTASVLPVDAGASVAAAELVDQNGRLVRLDRAFLGKTTLISFVFTRCPIATSARPSPASLRTCSITSIRRSLRSC